MAAATAGVVAAGVTVAAPAAGEVTTGQVTTGQVTAGQGSRTRYQATIVRTRYGVPHITAGNFGSLGYGYGYALASDDLCTLAQTYVTVEGQRSLYFGPSQSAQEPGGGQVSNLDSDILWRSVIGSRIIPKLLAVRTGPGAITPQVLRLMTGYVAGYNAYLTSVGGSRGVPDPVCRGKAWVKPITTLDAYLVVYQLADLEGLTNSPEALATAQPPASTKTASARPAPAQALSALASRLVRTAPGTDGLPSESQLRKLGQAPADQPGPGSNAIAIGSAGTRDHQGGLLLGNPHLPWQGALRLYQVQLTIPGTLNVEGATVVGIPAVVVGFTASMAWSETTSRSWTGTPYQLTLVPGHPTEYVYNGKPVPMSSQTVTVPARTHGAVHNIRHMVWFTRYGPVVSFYHGPSLPWTTKTAFALADADAANLRLLNQFLAFDQARSAARVLSALKEYQGGPWNNTIAADASGHALYADILPVPHVTNAEAARCDTAIGTQTFSQLDLPVLNGSRPSCAWGTSPDAAAPGIFGGDEEPTLMRRDFVENSNDSYWLANPRHPLTGYARIFGDTGKRWGAKPVDQQYDLRTRSALTMIMQGIAGTGGHGQAGFTFADLRNLMYSDVQYGATLVKSQLVAMCRSFPHGLAPTSGGGTIPVGDSCDVLATWNGTENPGSRGALLFQTFWCPFEIPSKSPGALCGPGSPWTHPFQATDPVQTPYGLNTTSKAVQDAFGNALATMQAAHLPYNTPLGTVQYVTRDGKTIPLPGGPADPGGEFNAMYVSPPGAVPDLGSTYIQAVSFVSRASGGPGPQAATVVAYSESDNPASPHYDDQTKLFSHRQWVTAYFWPAQVAAHAVSTTVVSSAR